MEINPIGSKDVLHGVPTLYKEIFSEITDHVDRAQNPEAYQNQVEQEEELADVDVELVDNHKIFTDSFRVEDYEDDDDQLEDDADEDNFFKSMLKKTKTQNPK